MHCPECLAELSGRERCEELFHQVLAWEQSDPERNGRNHHLLVMCWEIQHPSRFSRETIAWAEANVVRVVHEGISAQQLRREVAEWAPQDKRGFKITRDDGEVVPRHWTRTLADVVAEGFEGMPDSVLRWAEAVAQDLEREGGSKG